MKEQSLFGLVTCLSFAASGLFGAQVARGQELDQASPSIQSPLKDADEICVPACRIGYVCHPRKGDCVSACNPPCADWEVCSEDAQCVQRRGARAHPSADVGDRRFRIVLLGRFGLVGRSRTTVDSFVGTGEIQVTHKPGATLGFDLRFEKPVAKYVSVGGLISNYWLRAPSKAGGAATRSLNPNDYAFDIAPFVKPRYPFRIGKREAEAYLLVYVGGSLRQAAPSYEVDAGGGIVGRIDANPSIYGGFNWGVSPGFQIFVAQHVGLLVEFGYAYSWFKLNHSFAKKIALGQGTLRFGFTFAF